MAILFKSSLFFRVVGRRKSVVSNGLRSCSRVTQRFYTGQGFNNEIYLSESKPDIHRIAEELRQTTFNDEPFFVCDLGKIISKYYVWGQHFPRVSPYYAVKANNSTRVLEILNKLGTGFDCASQVEMENVLNLGVPSNRVIYAHPAKPLSHITWANRARVNRTVVDSEIEIQKVFACNPNAELVIRIRCEDGMKNPKYGAHHDEIPHLLNSAKSFGLNVIGLSFHVGTDCQDTQRYRNAISTSKKIFEVGLKQGYKFRFLDIGGGFPGNDDRLLTKTAEEVNAALDKDFPEGSGIQIAAEPGRFFVSSAFTLVTTIHSVKKLKGGKYMYYINDGIYGSFETVKEYQTAVKPVVMPQRKGSLHQSTVWGPTCDSVDVVCENILLPKLSTGDSLVFPNMGAYSTVTSTTFNGFQVPKIFYVCQKSAWKSLEGANKKEVSQLFTNS